MGLLDYLCYHVRRLTVIGELHSVINLFKLFIDGQGLDNRLVHLLIVRFEVRGCDLLIFIKQILKKIAACDSK